MSKRKTPATEAKPASTVDLRPEGRLARIAKALVSGATVTEIAKPKASTVFSSFGCAAIIYTFSGRVSRKTPKDKLH